MNINWFDKNENLIIRVKLRCSKRVYYWLWAGDYFDKNCVLPLYWVTILLYCERSEAEQAHSHVMGSENSALTPKISIFRKNGTDEKSLIFGCEIDRQNLKNRPSPGGTEPGRAGPGRFFLLHISILHPKIGVFSSVHFFRKINILGVSALFWV